MKLKFWGATEDVTGSMSFLETQRGVLMIDCGLAQGPHEVKEFNELPLPYSPREIKAILITHAHLDHSGFLPRLTKKGFHGPIYCTLPTARLLKIILHDSAKLNPDFYDHENVQQALNLIRIINFHSSFEVLGIEVSYLPAGHILGAASVHLKLPHGSQVLFSGDLGRSDDPLHSAPAPASKVDFLIMESTYGGKTRSGDMQEELRQFLKDGKSQARVGIIASFAVARAQNLLTLIHDYFLQHPQDKIPMVIDGPMMKEANKVYQRFAHETKKPQALFDAIEEIEVIEHEREWESLKKKSGPLLILSSSGMLTGGRIGRHLKNWHQDEKAVLFLPGYQGQGTPGKALLEGHHTLTDSLGHEFEWKGKVKHSETFSSHADQVELLTWAKHNQSSQIYLIHGESTAKAQLKEQFSQQGYQHVHTPYRGEEREV